MEKGIDFSKNFHCGDQDVKFELGFIEEECRLLQT